LSHWTQHDIRRTVQTELSGLVLGNEVAEMVIAHRRQGVEAVYDLHRYDAEKRSTLEAWDAKLREVVGVEAAPASQAAPTGRASLTRRIH
jgi:hypothetical protein